MTATPTAIDLFAGCGGLTTGLKRAGFRVLAAVEIDEKISETYFANHPEVHIFPKDIRNREILEDLLSLINLKRGELDLLAGCPPCQGFSRIRRRNKQEAHPDERNDLVQCFSSLVNLLFPKVVMMENVPGMEMDERFSVFVSHLENLGYKIDHGILDLDKFGVPQRRKRLVLLASRTDKVPNIAEIAPSDATTVRETIGDLPPPEESNNALHKLVLNNTDTVKKRIAAIPKDGGSRSQLPEELTLECHRRRKNNGFRDVYGRMAWDGVSPTITGGCFNPSKGRFVHPDQDRAISIFEASLLQSFPRDYVFFPEFGICRNAEMIGNALPPKFAEAVSKYALELL